MLHVNNVTLSFGKKPLFKEVNIKFRPGNCYGLIGANGAGKSTFLKIISSEIEANEGEILTDPGERIAILIQDQFAFDEYTAIDTVIMGHKELYQVMQERDEIYSKEDFSDEDGMRASELEEKLGEMNGYEADSEARTLLSGLGVDEDLHDKNMKDLESGEKVKVLLAQAIFGNPDILLLDEPTNHLDLESVSWLEEFLINFKNTVIVVSHDRHFLNKVCTHIADIDYGKIQVYTGNYSFWQQASELALKQRKEENKKIEEKRKELQQFVERFSSNASKAKQATSRKKLLEKLTVEEIKASSRKYPYIDFKPERECGRSILEINNLSKTIDGEELIRDFSLLVGKDDKIVFLSHSHLVQTTLFQILTGEMKPDSGSFTWGETITFSYFPRENSAIFDSDMTILQWIKQFTDSPDESFARGFLGRMLFSGDEALKHLRVLSGGEKVRCLISKMMLSGANTLIMDDPTNHLDLETITSLNNGLIKYPEIVLFTSHDHEFISTIANRIIEITPGGVIDRRMAFDDYIESEEIQKIRDEFYHGHMKMVL
ncbi:MAG: ATP-binding cassette domain-containing protein [Spirochaetes bacterium]|nr:ATP-binding cassette domain-containing protein [Spirochaetota bacterium]